MRRKIPEIILNLLFWLSTGILIVSNFSIEFQEVNIIDGVETMQITRSGNRIGLLCLLISFSAIMFYLVYAWLIKLPKKVKWNDAVSLAIYGLFPLLLYFLLSDFFSNHSLPGLPLSTVLGIYGFYMAVAIAYGLSRLWIKTESARQQLILEKKDAELGLLRAQLQPHFLFNVLNSLLSMVDQDKNPRLAESMDKLSNLLRYVVYETRQEKVLLTKEIEFLKDYIYLQSTRYEEGEIDCYLEISGSCVEQEIEPGIFLPFVENAFKHGILPEENSEIFIDFDLSDNGKINFKIKNAVYQGMAGYGGSGLINIRKRLDLVYGEKYQLDIKNNDFYVVNLIIETS